MTTATITDLELLRARVSGAIGRQMPGHIARLGWDGDFDPSAAVAAVRRSLRQAGLSRPEVSFRQVGALDRDRLTSKARRFIPLSARLPRPAPAAPPPPAG
jgi:hypothetical protein